MADPVKDKELADDAALANKVVLPAVMKALHGQKSRVAVAALINAIIACVNQTPKVEGQAYLLDMAFTEIKETKEMFEKARAANIPLAELMGEGKKATKH